MMPEPLYLEKSQHTGRYSLRFLLFWIIPELIAEIKETWVNEETLKPQDKLVYKPVSFPDIYTARMLTLSKE